MASTTGFTGHSTATVRIHAPWDDDTVVFESWSRYLKDGNRWNSLELICKGEPDWWVIFNHPKPGFELDPSRTLLYQHEPSWIRRSFPAPWNEPPDDLVAGCHTIPRYQMPFHWAGTFRKRWSDLAGHSPEKTRNLSSVISGKAHSAVARLRRDFIACHADRIPGFDVFGFWKEPPCNSYLGPIRDKSDGLLPYRYTVAAENCFEENYFSEKITDAIVSETLAFYSGCPNLEDFVDPECFIRVDLGDHCEAASTIMRSMENGEWEKRLPAIRREKERILHDKLFFADLEKHIAMLANPAR